VSSENVYHEVHQMSVFLPCSMSKHLVSVQIMGFNPEFETLSHYIFSFHWKLAYADLLWEKNTILSLKSIPEVVQIRLFYHCDTVSPTIAAWSVRLFLSGSDSSEQMFKKKKKKKHRTVYYCNLMIRYDRQSRDTSSLHLCLVCFFIYWSMITIVKNAATSTVFC